MLRYKFQRNENLNEFKLISLVLFFGLFLFLSGCVQDSQVRNYESNPVQKTMTNTQKDEIQSTDPINQEFIKTNSALLDVEPSGMELKASQTENSIRNLLVIRNHEYEPIRMNGTINYIIFSNPGTDIRYFISINITETDFINVIDGITGENLVGYMWDVPYAQINKTDSDAGTIYIGFEHPVYKFIRISVNISGIPTI